MDSISLQLAWYVVNALRIVSCCWQEIEGCNPNKNSNVRGRLRWEKRRRKATLCLTRRGQPISICWAFSLCEEPERQKWQCCWERDPSQKIEREVGGNELKAERNRLFAASAVSIAACFEIGKKDNSKLGFIAQLFLFFFAQLPFWLDVRHGRDFLLLNVRQSALAYSRQLEPQDALLELTIGKSGAGGTLSSWLELVSESEMPRSWTWQPNGSCWLYQQVATF